MNVDWQPLCEGEPVPGDPEAIVIYGEDLTATAALIAAQVAQLQSLSGTGAWQADTADAFRDTARDLAGEIAQAEQRYRTVGSLVTGWGQAVATARAAAERLRLEASTQQAVADANPEVGPEPAGPDALPGTPPAMTPAGLAQNTRRARALEAIDDLRGDLGRLVRDHEEVGRQAGQQIRGALSDGLNDRWQDRLRAWVAANADQLRRIASWAGWIAAGVGLLALMFTPLGWVALAAALVAVAASALLVTSGDGSWVDLGLNVVGALSFGLGAFMTKGVSAAFRAGRGLRADQAAQSARLAVVNAPDGVMVSVLGRVPGLGSLVRGAASSRAP